TKHQVAEVTSLGLVQMTRKRVGQGLLDAFSEPCEHCGGRGVVMFDDPVGKGQSDGGRQQSGSNGGSSAKPEKKQPRKDKAAVAAEDRRRAEQSAAVAKVAAAARAKHEAEHSASVEAPQPEPPAESAAPPHGDALLAGTDGTQ
ncbi:MAG: ribonuclease E/G, partial [Actinomycetes bacterium]